MKKKKRMVNSVGMGDIMSNKGGNDWFWEKEKQTSPLMK